MSDNVALLTEMAERCREMILSWDKPGRDQPTSLQPKHLEWMCNEIAQNASDWPATKVHRWIGFIQGAMIANRMIDLEGAKTMFDSAKIAYEESEDLSDHLNPDDFFELDIGGEG